MLRRILISLLLFAAAARADAGYYTDIWYNASEPGWGVNLVQSDTFIFVTFFIYGKDGAPTWYVATLDWDGMQAYKGDVYATRGTFFGSPWISGNSTEATVGTATFTPSTGNAYQGTLAYTVTGVGAASHVIERQTLTRIPLAGLYLGGESGSYSGCDSAGDNGAYAGSYELTVTEGSSGKVTFAFDYGDLLCTLSGTLRQNGLLYSVPNASYKCNGDPVLDTTATLSEIKLTAQGIEGRLAAPSIGAGCRESNRFAAVLE